MIPIDPKQGELLALPVEVARKRKFDKGRAEHGPIFKLDPLVEMDQELLDSLNYCDEAERRGHCIGEIREKIYSILHELRTIIVRDGLVHYDGTHYTLPVHADINFSQTVYCNSCGANFPEGVCLNQASGCAATFEEPLILTGYGSDYDTETYVVVGKRVPSGNICDTCITELISNGYAILLRERSLMFSDGPGEDTGSIDGGS